MGDGVLDFGKVATIVMKNESNFFACLHGNENKYLLFVRCLCFNEDMKIKKCFWKENINGGLTFEMNEDWNEKTTKKTKRKAMCKNMKLVEKELAEGINDNFLF